MIYYLFLFDAGLFSGRAGQRRTGWLPASSMRRSPLRTQSSPVPLCWSSRQLSRVSHEPLHRARRRYGLYFHGRTRLPGHGNSRQNKLAMPHTRRRQTSAAFQQEPAPSQDATTAYLSRKYERGFNIYRLIALLAHA